MSQANREILFRGRVLYNGNHRFAGEWVYGFYWTNYMGNNFITICCDKDGFFVNEDVEVDPDTLGQYTGLKDKGLKKIFEGDIVRCDARLDRADMVVIFEEGEFHLVLLEKYNDYIPLTGFYCIRNFIKEVIGNIHEQGI